MDGAAIVTAVVDEGGFDVASTGLSRATVTSWVAARYSDMVARARFRQALTTIGTTVAGTATYSIASDVVDIEEVRVGLLPYQRVGARDMWDLGNSDAQVRSGRGVFSPSHDSSGTAQIQLFPVPETSGDTIYALASLQPAAFTDSSGFTPIVPSDFHQDLVDGAIATGLRRIDERHDAAEPYEARFQDAVERLRQRKLSLVGQGVQQLSVRRRP